MNNAKIRVATAAAAAILMAGLSVPASAQLQNSIVSADQRAGGSSASGADNRRVCVRMELTGSRLARNVCRTRAEWERAGGLPSERD